MTRKILLSLFSGVALSGCAAFGPGQVAQPGNIDVTQALTDVVQAFKEAKVKEGATRMGVYVCMIKIHFNISASANKGGKLLLDATIRSPGPVSAGFGGKGEEDVGSNASRGNDVTMLLTSPMCVPKDTAGITMAAHVGNPVVVGSPAKGSPAVAIPAATWKGFFPAGSEAETATGTGGPPENMLDKKFRRR